MGTEEIKERIANLYTLLGQKKVEVNIMLVDQNNQRKQRYKGYMLSTVLDDIGKVTEDSLSYLLKELARRTLVNYDLEISVDDSLQMVPQKDVLYSDDILGQITVAPSDDKKVSVKTDFSKIKFIVMQVSDKQGKSIYLFKKYVQPTAAYQKTVKFLMSGDRLEPFTKEVITISPVVDAFLTGDTYFVLNRNNFNSIFSYKDVFKRILDKNQKMISNSGLLVNSSDFISDCEADGRYLTRLTKAILAKGFEEVSKRKEEIPAVVKDFNLSLQVDNTGKIVYSGKEDIPVLLDLLLRHYVIDALTNDKMIAEAIREYRAVKGNES